MTSPNATPLLALNWDVGVSRSPADWATLLSFGAIQWPWLLVSLYGGRRQAKKALLDRLGLPADALPNLGSWKADTGLLHLIVDTISARCPTHVVELGAGASTLVAARALKITNPDGLLTSFDQHEGFVDATRDWLSKHGLRVDLRHAPLVSPTGKWRDLWYDLHGVPERIDLLLIDGPPWTIDPEGRAKAAKLFDRIGPGGIIILDDAARPGERLVARTWKRDWPDFDWRFVRGIKGALIGVKC